jgi:enoyl-[acyl-carrier protein] reductase III
VSNFEGASVLVTGGSRGIGRAIARRFAELGAARIAIGYLRADRAAEETAEELRGLGAEPVLVRGNVASERVASEVAALGPLDVLVHNAATGVIRPALETEDKHFDWTLAANARALLSLARAAAPSMRAGSSIVGVSSLGSTRVLENYVLVGTSKAALEAIVRYLAVELAPRGIRVNAVSAGVVETGALDYFPNREQMLTSSLQRTPAGRLVEPDDVARAVCFLCSPDAEMVRGQTLVVDGGFSLLA